MKTLRFKTNINGSGCVTRAIPIVDTLEENVIWNVDTRSKDKVLEVQTKYASPVETLLKN